MTMKWILCQKVSTSLIFLKLSSTKIIIFTLFSTQIVILKLRQKAVTAVDHDRRHWKAAKVTFYHFFHYSERGQTSEENNLWPRLWSLWCPCSASGTSWPCWSTPPWEASVFPSWSLCPMPWRLWSCPPRWALKWYPCYGVMMVIKLLMSVIMSTQVSFKVISMLWCHDAD